MAVSDSGNGAVAMVVARVAYGGGGEEREKNERRIGKKWGRKEEEGSLFSYSHIINMQSVDNFKVKHIISLKTITDL